MVSFPPFRLDEGEEQLWKGTKLLAVRRKPFAILRYLVANPRRLVTHEELLKEVWGGSVVSESSVRTHLHELRQVLGEGLIETVIGRGYRFTAEVAQDGQAAAPVSHVVSDRIVVGRDEALGVLRGALDRARQGQRQLVFLTGEPGIGKTTLVDAFLDALAGSDVVAVRGHSIEQHSTPEAYRPVIELLGQLRHGKHGEQALASLVRYAPTFLAQVPHLVPDAQQAEVLRRASGSNESKMVRELIEALEAVCMQEPLVVVLEDLQWSDVATIDLLSLLGQRRERAKLMVIATSRRAEAQTVSHPLNRVMRALVARSGAIALPLERLEPSEIAGYIEARFPGHAFPPAFAATIENITAGTPLFVVAMLDDLVARGMLGPRELAVSVDDIAAHRPDSLKQLIDIQLDRLTSHEQRVLEAASLIGSVFATALVAAALEIPVEQADEICDGLARRALFLQHEGTEDWPEGSQQSCYGFTHGLVREVCADRSAPARRQRWYRLVAERLEAAYGDRAHEVSTMLATHYERGQAIARAVHFHIVAAERMARRFASIDALPAYRRALELIKRLPESRERDAIELRVLGGMSSSVLRIRFETDESIGQFRRMIELARRLGDTPALCAAMVSLTVRYATLGMYQQASEANVELAALATTTLDPIYLPAVAAARALPLFWQGKLVETIELLEPLARADVDSEEDVMMGILDPAARKTVLISYLGAACWAAGSPDRGIAEIMRARTMASDRGDPYVFGLTTINIARIHYLRRDAPSLIQPLAASVLANADAQVWHVQAELILHWVRSTVAPLDDAQLELMMRQFRERTTGFPMGASYIALTAIDALRRSHRIDAARALTEEMLAMARKSGELLFEPELTRIQGELLEPIDPAGAARTYRDAMTRADRMGAHGIALRAAISLARLEQPADLGFLTTALSRMCDGEQTADVLDAQRLLT